MWTALISLALAVDPLTPPPEDIDILPCQIDPAQRWMLTHSPTPHKHHPNAWRKKLPDALEVGCMLYHDAAWEPPRCSPELVVLDAPVPREVDELLSWVGLQRPEAATWVLDGTVVDPPPVPSTLRARPVPGTWSAWSSASRGARAFPDR